MRAGLLPQGGGHRCVQAWLWLWLMLECTKPSFPPAMEPPHGTRHACPLCLPLGSRV